MKTSNCPVCQATLQFSQELFRGELIQCVECGVDLEVISVNQNQIGLGTAPEIEEDWGE